eukprot:1935910-Prymnesium_polylepis.1
MRRFRKELKQEVAPPVVKEFACPKCPRIFDSEIGLRNHEMWHSEHVQDRPFFPAEPPRPRGLVDVKFEVDAEGDASVTFSLGGLSIAEAEAD